MQKPKRAALTNLSVFIKRNRRFFYFKQIFAGMPEIAVLIPVCQFPSMPVDGTTPYQGVRWGTVLRVRFTQLGRSPRKAFSSEFLQQCVTVAMYRVTRLRVHSNTLCRPDPYHSALQNTRTVAQTQFLIALHEILALPTLVHTIVCRYLKFHETLHLLVSMQVYVMYISECR